MHKSLVLLVVLVIFTGCGVESSMEVAVDIAQQPPESSKEQNASETPALSEHGSFYTMDHYDPAVDPADQLVTTLERAQAEKKTVLLQVGGDWCGWCKLMSQYIADNSKVSSILEQHYLIQKVTFESENPNEAFLSQYPKIQGYPHIFVLDASGNLLHSQNTGELEEGKGYSEEAFLAFLDKWKPAGS